MLCSMMQAIMRRSALAGILLGIVSAGDWPAGVRAQGGLTTTIDFRAVGADGKPIRDLKAEEVTIRVAGRPRPVKALRMVEAGGSGGAGAPAAAVPPPFGTNAGGGAGASGGRIVLIVVEDETLPAGGEVPLREAIGGFLDALSPADRVAFAVAPRDTAATGFGAGKEKIKAALAAVSGRSRVASGNERDCRSRDTLLTLRSMLGQFAGSAQPVILLFFSADLATPSGTSSGGTCDLTTDQYQNLGTTAAAARAHVFVINHHNSVAGRNEGLETVASVTGAGSVHRLAGQKDLLTKIVAETSAYYEATIDAESSDRAGQAQRMDLRVSRDGVEVHHRPEVVLSATTSAKPGTAPRDMLRETRAFGDLPLRVVGIPSRDAGGRIKVAVFAEPVDAAAKLTAGEIALIDGSGKFAPAVLDAKQLAGRPIVSALSVAPGPYRLRFAAVDGGGRAGAADYQINASLTDAGPLKMSGLMITGLKNNAIAPQLQFSNEPSALAYFEIYGELTGQVAARIEVASSLDGPALQTIQPGGQKTNEADKFVLTAPIPIEALKPGDYVVRAFVAVQGQPEGKIVATFRKVQ
jgi:hypothetical protein